jgi:hypothetical protein
VNRRRLITRAVLALAAAAAIAIDLYIFSKFGWV